MKRKVLCFLASAVFAFAARVLFAVEDIDKTLVIWWDSFDNDISMSISGSYDGAYSYTGSFTDYRGNSIVMSNGNEVGTPWSTVSAGYTVQFVPPTGYSISYYVVPVNTSYGTEFTQYAKTYTTSSPVKIDYSKESEGFRYGVRIRNIVKTANAYTVTLDRQNGTEGSASVMATYNSAMPAIILPVRTGYAFGGYFSQKDGNGTQYYSASGAGTRTWDKAADTTLYAKWTAKKYTVTFDRQNGSGGDSSASATYNSAMPVIAVPARAGYAFAGYYTAVDGGGVQYYTADGKSAKNWDIPANTTLYAKWVTKTYTVTFDRQNGSGGTSSVTVSFDSAMPAITPPTRSGYTFGGYYASSGGLGEQYYMASGESARNWDKTDNTTLYAKWTANSYNVNLRLEGGSGGTTGISVVFGEMPPAVSIPVYSGYVFDGYYDSNGVRYFNESGAPLKVWDKAMDTELYARWNAISYTITFDFQGGNGGTASASVPYNGSFSGHVAPPVREGYNFKGYFTSKNGNGTKFFDEGGFSVFSKWPFDENVTLYAYWQGAEYTIRFHSNNPAGAALTKSQTMVCGESAQLIAFSTFGWNIDGYNFLGWAYSPAATAIEYSDGATVQDLANEDGAIVDLYAVWEDYSYKVKFEANGGEGTMADQRIVMDVATELSASVFFRDGYSFAGWSSTNVLQNANATNWVEWADGATVSNLTETVGDSITLHAVWQPDVYRVSFDAGEEGTFVDLSDAEGREYIVGENYGSFPRVVNAKKSFAGWYVSTNGVQQVVLEGDIVPPESHGFTNFVARWEVNEITKALRHPEEIDLEFKSLAAAGSAGWVAVSNANAYVAESRGDFSGTGENVLQCEFSGNGILSFRINVRQFGEAGADDEIIDTEYLGLTSPLWVAFYLNEEPVVTFRGDKNKLLMARSGGSDYRVCDVDANGYAFFEVPVEDVPGEGVEGKWVMHSEKNEIRSAAWIDDVRFVVSESVTPTHKVPHSWIREFFPDMADATADQLEAKAESANGKTDSAGNPMFVWQDYVAGTDPTDLASVFKVGISVTNSVPYLWWTPDLGPERVYKILSKYDLDDTTIQTNSVEEAEKEEWRANRFFKVSVELP